MSRITMLVVVTEVVLAALGLLLCWLTGTPILEGARVDLLSVSLAVGATLPLVAALYWRMRSESDFMLRFMGPIREIVFPMFKSCTMLDIVVIAIMAGVGEELFFRAFLQGWLAGLINPWIAVVLVSVVFGVVHMVTVTYAVFAAALGLYIGALFLTTGNLFVAIGIHALFDFFALLMVARMPLPISEQELESSAGS